MKRNTLDKDIIFNSAILNRAAENLVEGRAAGVISNDRIKELTALGAVLRGVLGDEEQAVMDGASPLAPHILKAASELRKINETLVPDPLFVEHNRER